jgi:hypothetical protein
MARKANLPPADDDRNNDRPPPDDVHGEGEGDAHEPEADDGLDFDPVKLEADAPAPPPGHDPYDPAFLGLSQDFAAEANVGKKWDIIKVEKPSKSRVFRVHADPRYRLKTTLLVLKEDNETYLVLPTLRAALAGESLCGVFTLLACASKGGTPFLWPIRMADPDGKWNVWHQSAWQIAEKAQQRWCRMQANRDAGHYVAEYDARPPGQQHEPAWPELTFADWLRLAFQGYTIDSLDHPVLKRLRLED